MPNSKNNIQKMQMTHGSNFAIGMAPPQQQQIQSQQKTKSQGVTPTSNPFMSNTHYPLNGKKNFNKCFIN
jgi:hypothetical protein